jgi:hypothetical protein
LHLHHLFGYPSAAEECWRFEVRAAKITKSLRLILALKVLITASTTIVAIQHQIRQLMVMIVVDHSATSFGVVQIVAGMVAA